MKFLLITILVTSTICGCVSAPKNDPISELGSRKISEITVLRQDLSVVVEIISDKWFEQTGFVLPVSVESPRSDHVPPLTMELRNVTYLDALQVAAELCNYDLVIFEEEIRLVHPRYNYPTFVIRTGSEEAKFLGLKQNSDSNELLQAFKSRGVHTRFISIDSLGGDAYIVFGKSETELWMVESIWRLADRGYEIQKASTNSEN